MIPGFQVGGEEMRKLIFCDFANPKADSRNYIEVLDLNHLRSVCEGYLNEFNNMSKKPMNLVLFRYVLCIAVFLNWGSKGVPKGFMS
jgi:dynein heavy chain